jgi:hypothetical protein
MKDKLVLLTTSIGILFALVKPAEAQIAKLPASSGASCQSTVSAVKAEIARKGYYVKSRSNGQTGQTIIPNTKFDNAYVARNFYNYPPKRTSAIIFSGLKDDPLPDKLQVSLSGRIMADCPKVGLVRFGLYEGYEFVGYFPDSTVRWFG